MVGVTMLNSDFENVVTPAAGATEVAQNSLGESLVAYRPVSGGHTTVGVTAYVGFDATQSGDWGKVIVNAGNWLTNCQGVSPTPTATATATVTVTPTATATATATARTATATATFSRQQLQRQRRLWSRGLRRRPGRVPRQAHAHKLQRLVG